MVLIIFPHIDHTTLQDGDTALLAGAIVHTVPTTLQDGATARIGISTLRPGDIIHILITR